MKTLIVEDDFISRELLQAILSPYGPVNFAVNGVEAMAAFKNAWENNESYDLVCLDIMLPEMDGYQVLKEIRRFEDESNIKESERVAVIMTTALSDPRLVERAYKERCEAYLIKPISKEDLVEKISQLGLID